MTRFVLLSTAWFCASTALADYDRFAFSTNATKWRCPKGLSFDCIAPSVCAHEPVIDKWYCCGPDNGAVCWTGSTRCSGSDEDTPGANQVGCGSYCCLNSREECTQRVNQINICWATPANPLANLTASKMNETFSSLSSAKPTASTLAFDLQAALATSTPAPSASSSVSASSGSPTGSQIATSSPSSSPTQPADSSSGLSGGAIGGIVVGVVGGLALIAGLAFFFWRRGKKNSNTSKAELDANSASNNPYTNNGFAHGDQGQREKYAHEVYMQSQQHPSELGSGLPPQELDAGVGVAEVDGSQPIVHDQHYIPK